MDFLVLYFEELEYWLPDLRINRYFAVYKAACNCRLLGGESLH